MKPRSNSCADFDESVKSGRGQGRGPEYEPWLKISDASSYAVRSRVFCSRFARHIHLMSNSERLTLLQLEWNERVTEIREQYPLDPKRTLPIAKKLGFLHPGYTKGGTVMTTDFLVTRCNDDIEYRAYQVKQCRKDVYENLRTVAKLKIEEYYWNDLGIPWCVIYAEDFNLIFCRNLDFIFTYRNHSYHRSILENLIYIFEKLLKIDPELPFTEFNSINTTIKEIPKFDEAIKILVGHKKIDFPIKTKYLENTILLDFKVRNNET